MALIGATACGGAGIIIAANPALEALLGPGGAGRSLIDLFARAGTGPAAGLMRSCNPRFAEMFGYTQQEMTGARRSRYSRRPTSTAVSAPKPVRCWATACRSSAPNTSSGGATARCSGAACGPRQSTSPGHDLDHADRLDRAMLTAQRTARKLAVMFLDLDSARPGSTRR